MDTLADIKSLPGPPGADPIVLRVGDSQIELMANAVRLTGTVF